MNKKEYKTIDVFCAVCGSAAVYCATSMVLERVKANGGLVVRTGCVVIQAYAALIAGNKFMNAAKNVRSTIEKALG